MQQYEPDSRIRIIMMKINWLDKLFEEKDGFCEYIEMLEDPQFAHDPATRAALHEITKEESQHYKRIYDIIFKDGSNKTWTPMEASLQHYAEQVYKWMMEKLAEVSKPIK